MSTGGNLLTRRCVVLNGGGIAAVVGGLAEAQGHQVAGPTHEGRADLLVLEATTPELVEAHRGGAPILVVVPRRIRDAERRAFEAAGAGRVCDAESSILDVAFAMAELLFATLRLHRRYARQFGGLATRFWEVQCAGSKRGGTLVAVARSGAYLVTKDLLPEGREIQMEIGVNGVTLGLRGRVTYVADSEGERGFGVEFALDHPDVAPRIFTLTDDSYPRVESDRPVAQASV